MNTYFFQPVRSLAQNLINRSFDSKDFRSAFHRNTKRQQAQFDVVFHVLSRSLYF